MVEREYGHALLEKGKNDDQEKEREHLTIYGKE